MNIRKWQTNVEELRSQIECDREKDIIETKVLGIKWNKNTDELAVDLETIFRDDVKLITKRSVLQAISRIYDPLSMLGPFVVRAKLLIQEVWKMKLGWDENLPEDLVKKWCSWCHELPLLQQFYIPRHLGCTPNNEKRELHIFADASPQAYGAVAYVKSVEKGGTSRCEFLMAKGRVAPINEKGDKSLTLPKLELTAALCAARLKKYLDANFKIDFDKTYLWSDSKITLSWIKGDPGSWKPYVANRVREIQRLNATWNYCPGKQNPADFLTRGVTASCLLDSNIWKQGPEWLIEDECSGPSAVDIGFNENISSLIVQSELEREPVMPIFAVTKYSSFEKMLRVTAYVMRFICNMKNPQNQRKDCLSADDLEKAEIWWLSYVQNCTYRNEVTSLRRGKPISLQSSILSFSPFLDENGLLRLGGRLQESTMPYCMRHPIILPKNHEIVKLIIWKSHENTLHGGINITLNEVRKKYWIIQARQAVKKILNTCVHCKRFKGKAGNDPFAPLPKERINLTCPFQTTGTDFAGPLYVQDENGVRRKMYIMLFTCAATRAVHLELLSNISTEACVQGLRRFIARRGVPSVIYSDNAKTFKRTASELENFTKCLNDNRVLDFASTNRIKWKFIAERASWWGGWWERLVQSVKICLKLTLKRAVLNEEEMRTILTEVEITINSRPLTYISDEAEELMILSPAKFLIGNESLQVEESCANRSQLVKSWKMHQRLNQRFWRIWVTNYLQSLRSAHHSNGRKRGDFKLNDIVLVHDENAPRLLWKMAKVTQTYPGRDGRIRACKIQMANGFRTRRPIQLLYPLEIPPGEDVENTAPAERHCAQPCKEERRRRRRY